MRNAYPIVSLLVPLLLAACGGGDGPTDLDPPPGGASFTASINGQEWAATSNLTFVTAAQSGTYIISGSVYSGAASRSITLNLMNIPGPGTYPLGTGAGVSGGTAIYAENVGGWLTPLSGEAGSITITTLTTTRIAGTFSFTANASSGSATDTRTASNGTFDLEITSGTTTDVPEKNKMVIKATIGGQPYNASTVVSTGSLSTIFVFGGNNSRHSINIGMTNIPGPGTYVIGGGSLSSVQVGAPPGEPVTGPLCCWNGTFAGSTGSVTVTSITATRMVGTFTFILQPGGAGAATTPLTIANGSFDVGL